MDNTPLSLTEFQDQLITETRRFVIAYLQGQYRHGITNFPETHTREEWTKKFMTHLNFVP